MPSPGQTLLGTDFVTSAGGKGANQAVAAASIGIVSSTSSVHMIGRVGDDDMGRSLLQGLCLRKVCIDEKESVVSDTHTGVASITVDTTSGQNTIVVSPGANLSLRPEEVASTLTRILSSTNNDNTQLSRGKDVVLVQLEITPETAHEALKTSSRLGAITILNPAPAPKGWDISNDWLSYIDILIPNESELASLCGFDDVDGDVTGEGEEAMARSLLERGVRQAVIVTLGARGAMIVRRSSGRTESSVEESTASSRDGDLETIMISEPSTLPCKSLPVVDAVGAGDAFCGALAAYLSRGVDLDRAASMACGVASMSVRKRGAQESYPREENLPSCLRLDDSNDAATIVESVTKEQEQKNAVITFVTGNKNKLLEVQRLLLTSEKSKSNDDCKTLPFDIESAKLDLPELQGTPTEIAREKCRLASEQLQAAVMTEDTSLCFNALNGLPGPYIKWFLEECGHEGLNKMLDGFDGDRRAYAQTIIAFCPGKGKEVMLFEGRTEGKIVQARGPTTFGWDPIFEPTEGKGKTYAEMGKDEKNAISHRGRAFNEFREYLSTFSEL